MTQRFMLLIKLGDDGVNSPNDIPDLLEMTALNLRTYFQICEPDPTKGVIYDQDGRPVGSFCIEEDVIGEAQCTL